MIPWELRRGQIKHLLYELCLYGRISREVFEEHLHELNKVAPVVRCRYCKRYEPDLYNNSFGVCCHEEWVIGNCGSGVDADGFCYRGKRKDEVDNE